MHTSAAMIAGGRLPPFLGCHRGTGWQLAAQL